MVRPEVFAFSAACPMPTFLLIRGYRFYAYAEEGNEPAHVHIDKGSGTLKVWLADISVAFSERLKPAEIRTALALVRENRSVLLQAWNEWQRRKS
jgi:hypothetical protein